MIRGLEMALTRLAKVKKQVEAKMIQCLPVVLYQSSESRTKKWFTEDSYLALPVHLSHIRLSPSLHHFVTLGNKRKRKEAEFFTLELLSILSYIHISVPHSKIRISAVFRMRCLYPLLKGKTPIFHTLTKKVYPSCDSELHLIVRL